MVNIQQILCPVDLSDVSKRALGYARRIAARYEAHLTVLEVSWAGLPPIAYPASISSPAAPGLTPEERQAFLAELRAFCGGTVGPREELVLREGAVVPQVLDEAQARQVDLIVMGTHGRSGFDRFLLGSSTEKIIRKADCPVLTVPAAPAGADSAASVFSTILCAVDFSPSSVSALNYALSLAQEAASHVVLLHVFDWPDGRTAPAGFEIEQSAHRRGLQEGALNELRQLVPPDARHWCRIEELVAVGRPHEKIVETAAERQASLIVIGVHGRSLRHPGFFGSTTNQVVRSAECPVLTVRM